MSGIRGRLVLSEHLVRCCVEIAGSLLIGAVQLGLYAIHDRLANRRHP